MMKRNLVKILAFALSVVMFLTVYPKEALAAEQTLYISDIRMAHAGSESAAKKELTDAGYIVYDADLNRETKKDFVYIGYKTTTDPTEGITDIKMLKQDNGYQIYDSDAIMGAIAGEALDDAYSLMTIIDVFRANYSAGQSNALFAYAVLQKYRYSDTQMLGDFIIDPALTANGLTDIVMYADNIMSDGLYSLLAFGMIDDTGTTWLDRITTGIEYSVDEKLRGKARKVLRSVKSYQSEVYEAASIDESDKDATSSEAVIMSSDYLDQIKYKEGTLFDWLMKSEPTSANYYELTAALTDAELEAVRFLGFSQFTTICNCTPEMMKVLEKDGTDIEENQQSETKADEYDFWEGSSKTDIDRIGLTNDTIREMTISDGNNTVFGTGVMIGLGVAGSVMTCITIITVGAYRSYTMMNSIVSEIGTALTRVSAQIGAKAAVEQFVIMSKTTQFARPSYMYYMGCREVFYGMSTAAQSYAGRCTIEMVNSVSKTGTTAVKNAATGAARAMSASIILDIVLFLIIAGLVAYDIYSYYDPDYTEVPKAMLSYEENSEGDTAYVHYSAVLNVDGSVQDTNAFQGTAWNAMYFTTSDYMGEPIKAGSLTSKKTNCPVSEFGHNDAYNMNTNAFHDDTSVYVYFARVNADTLASIFSQPLGIGLIVGTVIILGGGLAAVTAMKAKKKKAKASAHTV